VTEHLSTREGPGSWETTRSPGVADVATTGGKSELRTGKGCFSSSGSGGRGQRKKTKTKKKCRPEVSIDSFSM